MALRRYFEQFFPSADLPENSTALSNSWRGPYEVRRSQ